MYDVDLMGAVRALEAARPFLERAGAEAGDAAFIITSSVSAAESTAPSAYGAVKAALTSDETKKKAADVIGGLFKKKK